MKPLRFVGSTRKDLRGFPAKVRCDIGGELYKVQQGYIPDSAKKLKGFSGVMELVERYDTDTYRAVYVANIGGVVYVLHCFKKSLNGGFKLRKKR